MSSDNRGCDTCMYTMQKGDEFPCSGCTHNAMDRYEPMTNSVKIRSMTDIELAEFLNNLTDTCIACKESVLVGLGDFQSRDMCIFKKCLADSGDYKKWLEQEAKNE